jgi:hypothetical protein
LRPQKIRIDIHSEFNLLLSSIIFDSEKMYTYISEKNELKIGSINARNLFQLLGVRIHPQLARKMLEIGFGSLINHVDACTTEEGRLILRRSMDGDQFTFGIELRSKQIEWIEVTQGGGSKVFFTLKYAENSFPVIFPEEVEFDDVYSRQKIKVAISQVDRKKSMSKNLFRPPFRPGLKIIQMDPL